MSQKATDDSVRMIAFGGMSLMVCAGGGIVMVASDFADPTVIGMICAAPAVLALPILALLRLAKRVKPEPEIHHHYTGPVYQDQRNVHSKNTGVWVKNTNGTARATHPEPTCSVARRVGERGPNPGSGYSGAVCRLPSTSRPTVGGRFRSAPTLRAMRRKNSSDKPVSLASSAGVDPASRSSAARLRTSSSSALAASWWRLWRA
jgi:hypothetical protein